MFTSYRKIITSLVFLHTSLLFSTLSGQTTAPASAGDTSRLQFYLDSVPKINQTDPKRGIALAEEGIRLAEARGDGHTASRLQLYKAVGLDIAGESQSAIDLLQTTKPVFLELGDTTRAADCDVNTGIAYYYRGELDQALSFYLQAYEAYHRIGNAYGLSRLLNNIGIIYRIQDKYPEAVEIYEEALNIKRTEKDSIGLAATFQNLGLLYSYQEKDEQSLHHLEEAVKVYQQLDEPREVASCYTSIGDALINLGRLPEAEERLSTAWDYFRNFPEDEYYSYTLQLLGEIALQKSDFARAHDYFEQGRSGIDGGEKKELLRLFLEKSAEANYGLGNYRQAYDDLKAAAAWQDSLTQEKRLELEKEMEARFEVAQREKDLEISQLALAKQQQERRYMLILLGIAVLVIGGVLYFLYTKNKTNRLLEKKNAIIEEALGEKELLLREIHHRVKNNLQFIASLLSLQSRHVTDDRALSVLQQSRSRVQSMSLLHQDLYKGENEVAVEAQTYLSRLIETIFSTQNIREDRIELKQEIAPLRLDVDTAIPLGLILNELVCNALKHAFSATKTGKLSVRLVPQEEHLLVEVADNGPGIAEEEWQNTDSFGYKLIQLLMEKLQASLNIYNKNGATVQLIIRQYQLL